jgi:hypothetical protein
MCLRSALLRDSSSRTDGGYDEQSFLADGGADGPALAILPEEPWCAAG